MKQIVIILAVIFILGLCNAFYWFSQTPSLSPPDRNDATLGKLASASDPIEPWQILCDDKGQFGFTGSTGFPLNNTYYTREDAEKAMKDLKAWVDAGRPENPTKTDWHVCPEK